jgi:leucyl aminopeptidase
MSVSIAVRTANAAAIDTPLLIVLLPAGTQRPGPLGALDDALGGTLARALERREFRAQRDETYHLSGGATGPQRVLLVGMGAPSDRALGLRRAAALAARQAHRSGVGSAAIWAPRLDAQGAENVAVGVHLGAWEYTDLKTPPPPDDRRAPLTDVTILADDARAARPGVAVGDALGEGYALARRFAMMPGNLCTPEVLAQEAEALGDRHDIAVTVFGREEMQKMEMGSFLCVAQGTEQDPKLILLEYRRGKKTDAPIVLVGKGLCFDTGGISIKPAERMELMKFDMCGAAGVLGAMEAIARLKLKVNVIGAIGSTTNMPDGNAVKPGDVVRASSGKTIEIINTDAEGRLVLADVLTYVKRYNPAAVIDAATLTGACVIALGNNCTGALGNDEALMREVIAASRRAAEPAWQLPLWDEYREQIKSDVADIKNTGGRAAGTITAAMFLREFVEYPWVHLDIAGTAYSETDLVTIPKGPTGIPVGTFVEFVRRRAR